MKTYLTLKPETEAVFELVDRKSRFIAACPCPDFYDNILIIIANGHGRATPAAPRGA